MDETLRQTDDAQNKRVYLHQTSRNEALLVLCVGVHSAPATTATAKTRSLHPKLQPSGNSAVEPSKLPQSLIQVSPRRPETSEEKTTSLEQHENGVGSQPQPVRENTPETKQTTSAVDYWRRSGHHWPPGDWSKTPMDNAVASRLLARKKSTASLSRKRSSDDLAKRRLSTPSDQKSREAKSAPYRDARYGVLLATKGSFMDKDDFGIVEKSKVLVQKLLKQEQQVPQESLFRDDIFEGTCRKIRDKSETRVIRDISLLIVPSAEILTTYGARELSCLTESVNEGWNNSISIHQDPATTRLRRRIPSRGVHRGTTQETAALYGRAY
ncbi:hypothetical protein ABVK25_012398 [Lepraria finkii]|uniref:DUF7924 domain-containing protein n=1 Tax=Lepraria finkii TaxID=1340010 RepID=A0ABR4AGH9_9LECA